ncbi:hypothetical protein CN515_04770 [Bacillus cereus]|uniref:hypothetical protein n=1 Tax=Bacillus cereus TaxID=1396 RepID=UPI000BF9E4A5|nr:hypothetical protein [Bacillus cereus]PES55362.1 hypothetical protein CN515_04770 [Bacillus cereus]
MRFNANEFIYATDEQSVYLITEILTENFGDVYYGKNILNESTRAFDVTASHYRKANMEDISQVLKKKLNPQMHVDTAISVELLKILNDSFLGPFITEGFVRFSFTNEDILYVGDMEFNQKAKIQPSKELFIELISKLAEVVNKEFDSSKPLLTIKEYPVYIVGRFDMFHNKEFYATIELQK